MNGNGASSWVWLLHGSSHLIMSLNCLCLGQAAHWLRKGQPTLSIWDRSPAGLLHPQHPQPLSPGLAPLFSGSQRARQGNQGKRRKGPDMPQWSGSIQPPSLRRTPVRKLALEVAWWCQLKPLLESQQAWAAVSTPRWWLLCNPAQGRTPGWTAFEVHLMLTQKLPEHSGNLFGQSPLCQPETLPRPLLPSGSSRGGGRGATPSHLELLRMTISSCQEGSRAEETTPPSVPTPSCSLFPLEHPSLPPRPPAPEPLPCKRVSHHHVHHHLTPLALPHRHSLCHWLRCRSAHPQNMPPLPSHTVHEAGAGEGSCPRHVGSPFPSPSLGPGSVFSAPGISPGGHGVGGREMPSPSPREATEECLHAKQNVTPSPTSSQSLHGL
uniref:uncharacterized protein LOC118555746 n=1 Tax=Halichoerus grypus TaxID=9711 RepID=UPI001658DB79|nr:uncharacterized protein LOC118555746 [Halichoerus grypus]